MAYKQKTLSRPFDPQSKSFGALLGQYNETRQIVVPEFQRAYSWEKEHVSEFWIDIREFRQDKSRLGTTAKKYFIGPIVILPDGSSLLLLDGQQRLATATILFSVLRDAGNQIGTQPAIELACDIQRDLIAKDRESSRFALKLGETDFDYFKRTVQKPEPDERKAKIRSHRLIETARAFLKREVKLELEGRSPADQVKILDEIKSTLASDVTMVAIEVGTEDDAYRIFDTLNDRGVKLTVPDLVLNFLMRKAPKPEDRREIRDRWNELVDTLAQRDIDKFLRHMWLSQYGDVKTQSLFLEIKNHIKCKKVNSVDFATTCADEGTHYMQIMATNANGLGTKGAQNVDAIVARLVVENAFPVLLSAHKCLDKASFAKVAKLTVALAVRYKVLANLNPYTLESTFYATARLIRELKGQGKTSAFIANHVQDAYTKIDPADKNIIDASSEVFLKKGEAQYILRIVENKLHSSTAEHSVDQVNLEHIFPEGAGNEWANADELQGFEWHLGNLTILGEKLNNKAANHGFDTKVNNYYSRSNVEMTKQIVANYAVWDQTAIMSRSKELVTLAVTLWRVKKR